MLDLLINQINNGLIVDGTGNPGFYGSVGVEGEKVHIFRRFFRCGGYPGHQPLTISSEKTTPA